MTKTLQKKFITTAMLAITVLILVLLGAINGIYGLISGRQMERMLGMLADNGGAPSRQPELPDRGRPGFLELPIDEDTDILVNTTSIGLYPVVDAKPDIVFDTILPHMVVCDVIPNHPHTQLLKEAEKRNAKTIDGLGMLINQAVESIRMWTGKTADAEKMKNALAKEYGIADVHY